MRYAIKNQNNQYLITRDSWGAAWSSNINDAKLFARKHTAKRTSGMIYSGYQKIDPSIKTTIVEVILCEKP